MESSKMRLDPLKAHIDESTDDFEMVRQSRMELMTLRKQRRKIEVLTEELAALEQMYVDKVEENIGLRAEIQRQNALSDIHDKEKDELLQELEVFKEKALNNSRQMEDMYHTIEQLKKVVSELKRGNPTEMVVGSGRQQIIDKMSQLHDNVADLTYKLDAQHKRKQKEQERDLQGQLRQQKLAHSIAEEKCKLLQYQLDRLKEQNAKLTIQKQAQTTTIKDLRNRVDQAHEQHNRSMSELNLVTFKKLAQGQSSIFTSEPKRQYIDGMNRTLSQLKQQQLQKIDELIESTSMKSLDQLCSDK